MKKQTHTNLIIRSSFALALALTMVIWSPVQSQSAEPAEGTNMTEAKMMERCQKMKERRQKMMVEMKAQDAELTAQVAKMNSAPEDKKLDLIAAVITRMVEQRTAMHARKAEMQEEMMMCPMMKDMKGMKGMGHKSMDTKKR